MNRPTYNNAPALLAGFPLWFAANRPALLRWWWHCDGTVMRSGGPQAAQDNDFEEFARDQFDRERAAAAHPRLLQQMEARS